jgi:signal transduction histidine kinase
MIAAMSSLKSRVFLACAFVAVLSIAVGTVFVTARVSREAEAELRRDLMEAAGLLDEVHRQRYETLMLLGWLVADLPKLKAAVATGDGPTVEPVARDYQERLAADVLVIADDRGKVLTSLGSKEPLALGEARARAAQKGGSAIYFAEAGEGILQVATLPVVVGPEPAELLGTLSVGFFLDDELARELQAITQSEVVLVARGRVVGTTIPIGADEVGSLVTAGDGSLSIGGEDYAVLSRTLTAPDSKESLRAMLLRPVSERLSFLRTFQEGLLLSALFGVLLAIVLSYAVARTVTGPLAAIAETMREITTTGNLARKIELSGPLIDGDATVLARAFNRLTDSIARFQRESASKEKLSALGRMSTVIAHEIRNPLMIIKTSLRSFRRRELSEADVREAADDIDHEVDRLNRIVGDVLDFARPIDLDLRPTDVNAVCRSAVEAVLVGESPPPLELSLDPELPDVLTDGERLRTALLNILANAKEAVEARPNGRDGSGIALETTRSDEGKISIVVRDRGVGIAPEDLSKIFEPYFTGKRTGTGLGLAITKNIVESLGGTVVAESQPSEGTEIRIVLFPRAPAAAEAESWRAERARPGGSGRAEGVKPRESGRPPRAKSAGNEPSEERGEY